MLFWFLPINEKKCIQNQSLFELQKAKKGTKTIKELKQNTETKKKTIKKLNW